MVGAAEPFLRDGGSGGGREVRAPGRLVTDVERLRHTVCGLSTSITVRPQTMLHGLTGTQAATCHDVSQSICQSGSLSVSFPGQTWFLDVARGCRASISFGCECAYVLFKFKLLHKQQTT
jgi:hypothetical protein